MESFFKDKLGGLFERFVGNFGADFFEEKTFEFSGNLFADEVADLALNKLKWMGDGVKDLTGPAREKAGKAVGQSLVSGGWTGKRRGANFGA